MPLPYQDTSSGTRSATSLRALHGTSGSGERGLVVASASRSPHRRPRSERLLPGCRRANGYHSAGCKISFERIERKKGARTSIASCAELPSICTSSGEGQEDLGVVKLDLIIYVTLKYSPLPLQVIQRSQAADCETILFTLSPQALLLFAVVDPSHVSSTSAVRMAVRLADCGSITEHRPRLPDERLQE